MPETTDDSRLRTQDRTICAAGATSLRASLRNPVKAAKAGLSKVLSGVEPSEGGPVWAVIAGGGTGGHVAPAIAIAQALVDAGHSPDSIHFVGAERGVERHMVPAAGFAVTLLPGRGIVRRLSRQNLEALTSLGVAFGRSLRLLKQLRPAVVVSVGGYASVPLAVAAELLRIPVVVAESNAAPGLSNRIVARRAKASAVAFAGTALPRAVHTGNPLRRGMAGIDRSHQAQRRARQQLKIAPDARVVLVSGGSLGAGSINRAVSGLAEAWAGRAGWCIYHVVGERDFEALAAAAPEPQDGGLDHRLIRFEQRMDLAYQAADVAVQRAGSGTVAELCAAGKPSILVPLPNSPAAHQERNAGVMAEAGAAVVLADPELDAGSLAETLDQLFSTPGRLQQMGAEALRLARPEAAQAVALMVEEAARG